MRKEKKEYKSSHRLSQNIIPNYPYGVHFPLFRVARTQPKCASRKKWEVNSFESLMQCMLYFQREIISEYYH